MLMDKMPSIGDAFGLVLLVYEAEVARRESTEGEMWSAIFKKLPRHLRQILFSANRQPKSLHKKILEQAARRW
ncbi:MAG: hypothetical protein RMM17_10825 [Acidobacteriota bacterium]|nr:hypothetical protein [Blastocatellia bacterium]MDW8413165.1 hypothetical protein [Acidobacteriota bacterium]